jgi:hypothetical protein
MIFIFSGRRGVKRFGSEVENLEKKGSGVVEKVCVLNG